MSIDGKFKAVIFNAEESGVKFIIKCPPFKMFQGQHVQKYQQCQELIHLFLIGMITQHL